MFRTRDLVLLVVVFSSALAGVVFPAFGAWFQPLPLYTMMSLLFLSFLSLRLTDVWTRVREGWLGIGVLLFLKMVLLPICVYGLFRTLFPSYALAALLLSGTSSGVVGPFMALLVGANGPLVLVMVVGSSLIVPFTLPTLVHVFFSETLEISLLSMIRLLFLVIVVPMLASELLKRFSGALVPKLLKAQYRISLCLFAVTNLGIFSKYAAFFHQQPLTILEGEIVALSLAAIYFFAGIGASPRRPVEEQLSVVIGFGSINNILVIVFSSHYFGPLEPTVAALYMIPFFGLILPMRAWGRIRGGRPGG